MSTLAPILVFLNWYFVYSCSILIFVNWYFVYSSFILVFLNCQGQSCFTLRLGGEMIIAEVNIEMIIYPLNFPRTLVSCSTRTKNVVYKCCVVPLGCLVPSGRGRRMVGIFRVGQPADAQGGGDLRLELKRRALWSSAARLTD